MTNVAKKLLRLYETKPNSIVLYLLQKQQADLAITYDDLIHGSANYTLALKQAGIQPGEVVILILQHGPDLVYAFFGSILNGSIPSIMPFLTEKLSPEQYRRSLVALFEITAPAAVITYPEFLSEVQGAILPASSVRKVLLSSQVYPQPDFAASIFDDGLQRSPQDILLLQHSSGTTGLQKGVALSHQAVVNQLDSYSHSLLLTAEDVIVSWLPLYHDMGLIAGFILPILCGIPLVLLSPFDWIRAPYKLLHAVTQYHGSLSWLPNFAYNFCTQKIRPSDLENVNLSSWRAVINCSEPMFLNSHQMFLDRFQPYGLSPDALATCYAMAENVFAVSQGGIDRPVTVDHISRRGLFVERLARPIKTGEESLNLLSAGAPIGNTRLRIYGSHFQLLPQRHVGEIAISSDCMLTGYYHRQDLDHKTFHDGWYLTGDLGYIANGEVYVTGRKKDLIIVGGKNIYPQDLETLASEVEGVHPGRVVAFGIPNEAAGTEDVVLLAETDVGSIDWSKADYENSAEAMRIMDDIRLHVTRSSDIALRHVRLVRRGWLQKTSSGKVARSANRERYLNELMVE